MNKSNSAEMNESLTNHLIATQETTTLYTSPPDASSKSIAHATVIPMLGGVLMLIPALLCLFFAVALGIWPPLGVYVWEIALAYSPTEFLIAGLGILAFALGLIAAVTSLLRRHFWLAVTCGGISLVPAFFAFLISSIFIDFPSGLPLIFQLTTALALAFVGLLLVAMSKKQFS